MDWGQLISTGIQAYGAYSSAQNSKDAAKDATNATTAASDKASQTAWNMYNQNRADQQPFYQAGLQAQDRYLQLLGLQPVTGQGAFSAGPVATQATATPQQWFGSASGAPTVNQALYDSDPRYASAWDQVAAHHQQQFGKGYTKDSDRNKLQSHMQQLYGQSAPQTAGTATGAATPALSQQDAFAQWRATPGYQFGLDEGNKQVQSSAAARGGLNSGATLKALQKFGTDYADQQGYTPYMNRLSGLFGGAQTAASNMGSYGQSAASNVSNNIVNAGNARAQGIYGAADAQNELYGDIGQTIGQWYGSRNKNTAVPYAGYDGSSAFGAWGQGWGG